MTRARSSRSQPAANPLPEDALEMMARRFRLLGDVRRLRILKLLLDGERSVGDIVEACGSSQANVSMHLAQLRADGLVEARRDGTRKVYRVADPLLAELCRTACQALADRAATDLARVEGDRAGAARRPPPRPRRPR